MMLSFPFPVLHVLTTHDADGLLLNSLWLRCSSAPLWPRRPFPYLSHPEIRFNIHSQTRTDQTSLHCPHT